MADFIHGAAVVRRFSNRLALAAALLAAALPAAGQTPLRPDGAAREPRVGRDTLFQSVIVGHRVVQIRAELDTMAGRPGSLTSARLTGRYAVYLLGRRRRLVTTRLAPAEDGPSVVFVSNGSPSVLVLSSYTSRNVRTAATVYAFKVLVSEGEQFRTFTVASDTAAGRTLGSDDIKSFERGPAESFTLQFEDGLTLRYRDRRMTVGFRGSAPN